MSINSFPWPTLTVYKKKKAQGKPSLAYKSMFYERKSTDVAEKWPTD